MGIEGIGAAASGFARDATASGGPRAGAGSDGSPFRDMFARLIDDANESGERSDQLVRQLASGQPTDLHDVMAALTEAEMSFRMVVEVRNKLIEAYQEIQRMPM